MKSIFLFSLYIIISCSLFVNKVGAQCSALTAPTSTSGCTREYFTQISASGTGVTSTITVSGLTSCSGFDFPDYSGHFSMGITAAPGNVVSMNLTRLYDPGYTAYVSVWVDWNNDDFYELSELSGSVMTWPAGSSLADSTMIYNFTVPTGAVIGTHLHMRLFLWDNAGSAPCSAAYGQAYEFWFQVGCTPPVVTVSPASASMCSGSAGIVLTASGAGTGGTYSWYPATGLSSATGPVVTATPAATTVYSVVGIAASGCSDTATSTITVNPPPVAITGITTLCAGSTTTLADASGSGTWASGNPAVATIDPGTGVATGVSAGTALVTFTLSGTGCATTTTVMVNPLPPGIAGVLGVCAGATTALTDAVAGGTWASSNIATATVDPLSGLVTGVAAGTASITYMVATGCATQSTVTVNPLPAPITGSTNICAGFTTFLGDATAGGAWGSSNTAVASTGFIHGLFVGVSAGTATVSYTLSTGCFATASFTVNPGPAAITGTPRICTGLTTTLGDATAGGSWSSNNTAIATTGTAGIVTGVSAGTATISYSPSTGCPAIITVTVYPVPSAISGPATVCAGSAITLSDAITGGEWSIPGFTGAAFVNATTGVVSGVSAGTASITYTLAAGCLATTTVTVNPVPDGITGTGQVCPGQSAMLSDATPSGTWASSGSAVTTGAGTGLVTGISAGTATISYILPTGCYATSLFTVNPLPAAIGGATQVCVGASITLTDASAGGIWISPGASSTATVGLSSGVVTGVSAGTLTITYTLPTGCNTEVAVTVNPLPAAITGSMQVCRGQTTTLNDATTAGSWSSASSTVTVGAGTGIVAGVSTGTAIITFITPVGCTATSTVTINPLPLPITGRAGVCQGDTITLNDPTPGGAWTNDGTGVVNTGSATGVATGLSLGTATITYTLPTGCLATTVETVDPLPAPISGATVVCQYFTTTLADATPGGIWGSTGAASSIGSSSGIVTGIAAGTASVTYTLATGCIATAAVTVNPSPAPVTGATGVCLGFTTMLHTATTGGTWSDAGSTTVAGIDPASGLVTGLSAGNAVASYTVPTGCYVTTTVTVNPLPSVITGVLNVCERATTILADSLAGGTWSSGETGIATANSASGAVTGVFTGTAAITYTSHAGCTATTMVNVILSPALIMGESSVCTGLTDTLADSTAGGTWSSASSAGIAVVGTTGTVTGVSGGRVVVTYTISTGCFSVDSVTIDQLPGAITGTDSVCAGSATALSDAVPGGVWSSSAAAAAATAGTSGIITGVAAGTAVITYSTGANCAATITVTVMPVIARLTGTDSVCKGSVTTLADAVAGGAWSSSNTAVATVNATGNVTGITPGTTVISYVVPHTCGAGAAVVTVNPLPDAGTISGSATLCTGNAIILASNAAGGVWTSGSPVIATVSSAGVLTGIAMGKDTVYYRVTNICGTATAVFDVTVNQTPDSANIVTYPATLLCANTMFQNFGTSSGEPAGVVYTWSAHNAQVYATSPDQQYCIVNFDEPGAGWVKLTSGTPGSNCFSADSILYTISSQESPDPTVVYAYPELICNDNTASSYQWGYDDAITLDSTLIPGAVNENYQLANPDFAGKYYWVMTSHNGCLQKSYYNQPERVTAYIAGDMAEMHLFPNPAQSKLNITFTGTGMADAAAIKVFDALGKMVKSGTVTGGTGSISLSGLADGAYQLIALKGGFRIGSATFVKNSQN